MTRMPWTITRDMFLNEAEVAALLEHLRRRESTAVVESTEANEAGARSALLDRLLVEALLFSGLRTSEFCGLRLGDFDDAPGQAAFVVKLRGRIQRAVCLPRDTAALVRRYIETARPFWLPRGAAPDNPKQPLVFHERRRTYERTGLYRRVVRILDDAGLGGRASVQLLRHTYGYLAYRRTGGNLLFVQRQLGHAHPMITSVYAQFADESYARLADQVASSDVTVTTFDQTNTPGAMP